MGWGCGLDWVGSRLGCDVVRLRLGSKLGLGREWVWDGLGLGLGLWLDSYPLLKYHFKNRWVWLGLANRARAECGKIQPLPSQTEKIYFKLLQTWLELNNLSKMRLLSCKPSVCDLDLEPYISNKKLCALICNYPRIIEVSRLKLHPRFFILNPLGINLPSELAFIMDGLQQVCVSYTDAD